MSLADSHAKGNYIVGVKMWILGAKVVNAAKEDLGTIEDVIIPWRVLDFHAAEGYAVLKLEKERLTNAPGFKTGEWPDMGDNEWVTRVDRHYGAAE
jgi:hypothetical protein